MKQKKFAATLALLAMVIFAGIFGSNRINASAASNSLSATYRLMYVGQSYNAKVQGSCSSVKWSSSNPNIAFVSFSGKVTGENIGVANIYATVNGKNLTLKVEVVSKETYKAISYANNAVGCRYSQARRMSKGYYDCSSLVWRSYASAGVYIGGKTSWAPTAASSASILNGSCRTVSYSRVSSGELLPGDVIYTSSYRNGRYRNITHTAMYVGNGKIVEAANSRVGVVKRDYSTSGIVLIARPTVKVSGSLQQPQMTSTRSASSSVNNTAINVSWKKVNGAGGYFVYRKAAGGIYQKIASVRGSSNVSYRDNTAYAGSYIYTVRAYSSSRKSPYNAKGMTAATKIATPSRVSASAADNGITVKWNTVKYATGYQVYRRASSNSYDLIKTVSGQSSASYKDTKAQSGTTYSYMVKAFRKNSSSSVVTSSSVFTSRVAYTEPVVTADKTSSETTKDKETAVEKAKETTVVAAIAETAETKAASSVKETTAAETSAETKASESEIAETSAAETAAAAQESNSGSQKVESAAEAEAEVSSESTAASSDTN